jgi:putative flippase GtrA
MSQIKKFDKKKEAKKHLSRFLVIGLASVATDAFFYWWFTYLGLALTPAKGISYALGMLLGFIGNKFWTFESPVKNATEPLSYALLYALTLIVNMVTNALVFKFSLNWLGAIIKEPWQPALLLAFFVATGLTTVLNFLGLRFITFRRGILQRRALDTKRF